MRNALQKHKTGDKIKWIVTLIVGLGLVACVIALTVRLNNNETTKTLSTSDYTIGLLSDTNGKVDSGKDGGLFTEAYYDVENAEIKLKENAEVSVFVNLYDADKAFLKVVKVTDKTKVSEIAASESVSGAKYVRFEVIPEEDADGKISTFEKIDYAGQVTITVNK